MLSQSELYACTFPCDMKSWSLYCNCHFSPDPFSVLCNYSDKLSRDDYIGTGFIRMSEISVPGENGTVVCGCMII